MPDHPYYHKPLSQKKYYNTLSSHFDIAQGEQSTHQYRGCKIRQKAIPTFAAYELTRDLFLT